MCEKKTHEKQRWRFCVLFGSQIWIGPPKAGNNNLRRWDKKSSHVKATNDISVAGNFIAQLGICKLDRIQQISLSLIAEIAGCHGARSGARHNEAEIKTVCNSRDLLKTAFQVAVLKWFLLIAKVNGMVAAMSHICASIHCAASVASHNGAKS